MINTTTTKQAYSPSTPTISTSPFITVFNTRAPTTSDVQYEVQQRWVNLSNGNEWMLIGFSNNNNLKLAVWLPLGTPTITTVPSFRALLAAERSNVTGDHTQYVVVYDSVEYDNLGNFDGVSTFTAPITGSYYFGFNIAMEGLDASNTVGECTIYNVANSGASLAFNDNAFARAATSGSTSYYIGGTMLLNAGNQVYTYCDCIGNGKNVSVGGATYVNYFCGFLIT